MMNRLSICTLGAAAAAMCWLGAVGSDGANRYVNPLGSSPAAPYTNWVRAAHSIDAALAVCAPGDVVTVATGHYDRASELVVPAGVTVRSLSGAAATVIDGQGMTRCVRMAGAGSVLEGFTVSEGRAIGDGGGIYCASGSVRNCVIEKNIATGDAPRGGGLFLAAGGVFGCVVSSNTAISTNVDVNAALALGGGLYCGAQGGVVERCVITGNSASGYHGYGGGIWLAGGTVDVCEVRANLCLGDYQAHGGGIWARGGLVRNSLVVSNDARNESGFPDTAASGAGICFAGCTGVVESCTVARNSAYCDGIVGAASGGGLMRGALVLNSILNGNWVTCAYTASGADYLLDSVSPAVFSNSCSVPTPAGASNTGLDPQFADERYALRAGSPCIDAGSNRLWMATAGDVAGNWRITGGSVDMGAVEYDSGPTNRFRLTWLVEGAGGVNTADGWYTRGAVTQVVATAVRHNHFIRWSGDTNGCTISANVIKVPVTASRTITASFTVDVHKLVVKSPYGGASPRVGTNKLAYGSSVTALVTNSPVAKGVSTQYFCKGWAGTGSVPATGTGTNTGGFELTCDSSVTWKWSTNYLLTISKSGSGTGSVSYSTGWYEKGSNLQVMGVSSSGSYLRAWIGQTNGCTMVSNRLVVPMTGPRAITADFAVGFYSYLSPVAPTGTLVSPSPRFRWIRETGASWNYLWINRNGATYLKQWVAGGTNWNTGNTNWVSGSYDWWIRAWKTNDFITPWSSKMQFRIEPYVPGVVTQLAPNGAVTATNRPLFVWRADPTGHSSQYYLWINRNDSGYMRGWVPAVTSCVTGVALPFGSYDWWVRGWSADGVGPWSTGMSFTIGVTVPLAPTGTLTGVTRPQFRWMPTPGAGWYYLWVNRAGVACTQQWVCAATNWTPASNLRTGSYQWWIRPWQTNGGYGSWSSPKSFTLQ